MRHFASWIIAFTVLLVGSLGLGLPKPLCVFTVMVCLAAIAFVVWCEHVCALPPALFQKSTEKPGAWRDVVAVYPVGSLRSQGYKVAVFMDGQDGISHKVYTHEEIVDRLKALHGHPMLRKLSVAEWGTHYGLS